MLRASLLAVGSFACGAVLFESSQPPVVEDPTRPIEARGEQSPAMSSALSKWIDVDFEKIPFQQAVRILSQQAGVSIVLDEAALANAMFDPNLEVSLHVKRVRLTTAFQLLLDPLNLTIELRPDVIVVYDKESTKKTSIERVYPAADLVLNGARGWADPQGGMLVRTMQDLIDRDIWEPNGGDAFMQFFAPTLSLVVHAPLDTQKKVESLLAILRMSRVQTVQLLEERDLGKLEDLLVALDAAANLPLKLKLPPNYPSSTQILNAIHDANEANDNARKALMMAEAAKAQFESLQKSLSSPKSVRDPLPSQ